MPNPHGTPIWYELTCDDPDGAKAFYDAVIGWTIEEKPAGEMDYRMITAGDGNVGGVMRLTGEMKEGGARPGWLFYVGVDDVDAAAEALRMAGGRVLRGPWDIPGIGRMAVVTDPQGALFYLMRGASEGTSTSFDPAAIGRCAWNELTTTDQEAAHAFYARLFGWSFADRMSIGEMSDYVFIDAAAGRLGATMTDRENRMPPHWRFYFRVPDVEEAAARVTAAGGKIYFGPVTVPNGERILIASDREGAMFGLIAR